MKKLLDHSRKAARKVARVALVGLVVATLAISVSFQGTPGPDGGEPSFPLPKGMRAYTITQAAEVWPRLTDASIDPIDTHVGETQTIELTVESREDVDRVYARITTDNDEFDLPLSFVKEVTGAQAGARKGLYRGSWTVRDVHNTTYQMVLGAEAGADESSVVMSWSDACGIPPGGSFTLSSPCTISAADGIDAGNFTLNSSLTLDADFAFNSGYAMTLGASGSLAICTNCALRTTNIWQIDQDVDDYPASGAMFLQDNAPNNGRRRSELQTTSDCDDTNPEVNVTCAEELYKDEDLDGHYSMIPVSDCGKGGSCESRAGDDCDDTDDRVYPGQTQGFTTPSNGGTFDYNCDGVWEQGYIGNFQGRHPGSCYWHPTWGCRNNPILNFEFWFCAPEELNCMSRGTSPECGVPFTTHSGDVTQGCYEQGGLCAGPDYVYNPQSCI